jgi:hypothetical protein
MTGLVTWFVPCSQSAGDLGELMMKTRRTDDVSSNQGPSDLRSLDPDYSLHQCEVTVHFLFGGQS